MGTWGNVTGTAAPAHAKLGASSMYRWSACPGSVRLCADKENKSSPYAAEGTLAHEIAADILLGGTQAGVDPEMLEAIMVYVDAVRSHAGCKLFVEHRFNLSMVHPDCFGTADAVVWNEKDRILYVYDYKHGAGIAVEVENNKQLQYYALGALLTLGYRPKHVEMVVVQPRCPHPDGPIRRWRIPVIDLLDFEADLLSAAEDTEDPNAPLVSGDHCRFCPASATCPELRSQALVTVEQVFGTLLPYEPTDLSEALNKVDMIEGWCKSLRSFAYNELMSGRAIPGWKLVDKRATRKWADDEKITIRSLAKRSKLNPDLFFTEPNLISPAQAEKVLKEHGLKKDLIDDLTVAVSSGSKLVRESEPGEPVKIAGADQVFDALPPTEA